MEEVRTFHKWEDGKMALMGAPPPCGRVVICADASVRNKFVYGVIEREIGKLIFATSMSCSVKRMKLFLKKSSKDVCVSLLPEDLSHYDVIVTMLRLCGAQRVYGAYLRSAKSKFPDVALLQERFETELPTTDELDGLIVLDV